MVFYSTILVLVEEVSAFRPPIISSPITTKNYPTGTRTRTTISTLLPSSGSPMKIIPSPKFLEPNVSSFSQRHLFLSSLTSTKASLNDITDDNILNNASLSPPPGVQGLSPTTNTVIFIIGIIPFLWATYEFWSRIAVGKSFGTGSDSIQIRPSSSSRITIGKDGEPLKSRGQQVLGDDALLVAYVLFAVAIGAVGIAIYSVVSTPMTIPIVDSSNIVNN
jgi:hypothetical protein